MSDYGDLCREQRERRRSLRVHWYECPHCKIKFGTGTKVAPGHGCRHNSKSWHPRWKAPGAQGDDTRAAEREDAS